MKFVIFAFYFILSVMLLAGCAPKPFTDTNIEYRNKSKGYSKLLLMEPSNPVNDTIKTPPFWAGTTNFGLRKPNFVIIHHTAQNSCAQTLTTFTTPKSLVSAHYLICKDGTVHHMLNDYLRAQHAGVSKWGNLIDINSSSIGIELDNTGFEAFDSLQLNSLLSLLDKLKKVFTIPTANFIGHGDIAPSRKNDPNWRFPWKNLAEKGFGLWFDDIRDTVPTDFNHILALRIVGYDVKDSIVAIQSFKRHFLQDTTKRINELDRSVLYNLQKKFL